MSELEWHYANQTGIMYTGMGSCNILRTVL